MKFNSSGKIILPVCSLIIVVLIIVILIIIPTARNISKTTQDTYQLRSYLEQRYQESIQSRLTKERLDTIKQESTNFDQLLFKKSRTMELIQLLEKLSAKHQLNQIIEGTNLDSITPGENLSIRLTVSGQYKNMLNYIHNLETIQYFVNLTDLRLSDNGSGNSSANFGLEIYVSQ